MRNFILFLFISCLLPACTSRYYLVRHAEKQDDSPNALLSPTGLARANILRDSLIGKGIEQVYASTMQRTQQTAQPLASALGLPLTIYKPDTVGGFVAALKKLRGKAVLVVGHSNNIPEIVQGLSGESAGIADNDYDNLFIVKITRAWGQTRIKLPKTTYGPVSP